MVFNEDGIDNLRHIVDERRAADHAETYRRKPLPKIIAPRPSPNGYLDVGADRYIPGQKPKNRPG
ncbi:hypothetical protein [Mesorhizobium sp. WSM1293]|uniref:hypothetical protein n=1 Tax=Mesorhizobium sp. WSM1293 TaxID=1040984 RepID=UPI000481EBDF|nr:hypothetical protein [Mesorhizobium sp. WSM1293]